MTNDNKELWEKAVAFHGHICPGLTIGYRVSLYAMQLLELDFSPDEQVVCIAENDACGVDAVQAILGCSVGKGNLLFHITGKQAFSFYNRKNGRSVRIVLNKPEKEMTREQSCEYYRNCSSEKLFTIKPATISLPEKARIFTSYVCDCCGESTASEWIRLDGEKKVCIDCCKKYDRFHV